MAPLRHDAVIILATATAVDNLIKTGHIHQGMKGMNKAIVAIVFGIALIYGVLSLMLTVQHIMDVGEVSLFLFAPRGDELGLNLSEYIGPVTDIYNDFIDTLIGYVVAESGQTKDILTIVMVVVGFVLSAVGFATKPTLDCKGTDNPVQYLWTHRPKAFARCLSAPWGIITGAWSKHKALVIIPVILLPFYVVWAVMLTVFLIIPFAVVRLIVGAKISSASKRESREYHESTLYAVCPRCKRNFERPKIKCRCGLDIDYPVPSIYGIKSQWCNNDHEIPCIAGKRGDLRTICPYCGSDIETREASPISIAMVGAVGSGKTTLMLAAVDTITKAARTKDIVVDPVTPGISKQAVSAKDLVAKSASGELDTECMFIRSQSMSPREMMFNDISGQEFEPKEGKTLFEEYYNYTDGIIFVYDPLSLGRQRAVTPMEIFESFSYMFTQITSSSPTKTSQRPFAIVATRRDATKLTDDMVRENLESNGQAGFVKLAEAMFSDVRFFSVNSVGSNCSTAANPVWWIVSKADKELASAVPIDLQQQ